MTSEVGSPERTLAAEVTFRADVTAGARIGPTFGQRAASQGRSVKHDMARAALRIVQGWESKYAAAFSRIAAPVALCV